MRCPKCKHLDDKVIDSRPARSGTTIRRRRVCQNCQFRFTTYERIARSKPRGGRRVLPGV